MPSTCPRRQRSSGRPGPVRHPAATGSAVAAGAVAVPVQVERVRRRDAQRPADIVRSVSLTALAVVVVVAGAQAGVRIRRVATGARIRRGWRRGRWHRRFGDARWIDCRRRRWVCRRNRRHGGHWRNPDRRYRAGRCRYWCHRRLDRRWLLHSGGSYEGARGVRGSRRGLADRSVGIRLRDGRDAHTEDDHGGHRHARGGTATADPCPQETTPGQCDQTDDKDSQQPEPQEGKKGGHSPVPPSPKGGRGLAQKRRSSKAVKTRAPRKIVVGLWRRQHTLVPRRRVRRHTGR